MMMNKTMMITVTILCDSFYHATQVGLGASLSRVDNLLALDARFAATFAVAVCVGIAHLVLRKFGL
jgi:hypothetical protein